MYWFLRLSGGWNFGYVFTMGIYMLVLKRLEDERLQTEDGLDQIIDKIKSDQVT